LSSFNKLSENHIGPCSSIVGSLSLYQDYGFSAEKCKSFLTNRLLNSHGDTIYDDQVLVDNDDAVLGFACFETQSGFGRSGYLRLIAIDTKSQGTGAGKLLMDYYISKYLKPYGILALCNSENKSALKFYFDLGFAKVGSIPDYVQKGSTEVILFLK
jgi:ribosomal protein S18 acetylase RimI-like enzyme